MGLIPNFPNVCKVYRSKMERNSKIFDYYNFYYLNVLEFKCTILLFIVFFIVN